MLDQYQREIDYLRISITDRCNLRCRYCMPQGIDLKPHETILSYEQIVFFVELVSTLGISKIKITGGEPLVRKDCAKLVKQLKAVPGIQNVTITTNGILLEKYLDELIEAGLDAINISLDTLDAQRYQEITGFDGLNQVLKSVQACLERKIKVKINCVAMSGQEDWKDVLTLARDYPLDVRFIEMMPIGLGKLFKSLDNRDLQAWIKEQYREVMIDSKSHGNGPATYYRIASFKGSVGFIGAIHENFCSTCNRIRLTSQGWLKCCLCYDFGMNILDIFSQAKSDEWKREQFRQVIWHKPKAHCFLEQDKMTENAMMSMIGG